jgi:hypothetical protein
MSGELMVTATGITKDANTYCMARSGMVERIKQEGVGRGISGSWKDLW